jgi:hypothetical protein
LEVNGLGFSMGESGRLVRRDGPGADEEDEDMVVAPVISLLITGGPKEMVVVTVEDEVRETGDEEDLEATVWGSSAGSFIYVSLG